MEIVMVDVCCNDPDNGLFSGCAEQIHIGSELIELECRRLKAPRFVEVAPYTGFSGGIRLADKIWPTRGGKEWVGNWCWNSYGMAIKDAVEFLAWLHRRNLFNFTCGEERLFNMWHLRDPFTADDLAFIERMLSKPSSHSAAA